MKHERDHGIFLTADGRFIKGKAKVLGAEIGQELEFVPIRSRTSEWLRLGVVAVLLLAVMVSGVSVYLTRPVIAAYVTIDINPSVELGIDRNEVVRSVTAINTEAERLIAGAELLGLHVIAALEVLMANAAQEGFLGPEGEHLVVITATTLAGQQTNPNELTAELDNKARAIVAGQEQTVVTAMVAAPEVREEALKQGVSVGKLMVAQKAEESGIHLDPQELKSAVNLSQSIRAAGGDPSTILKKGDEKPQDSIKADSENKGTAKQDTDKPQADKPAKANPKSILNGLFNGNAKNSSNKNTNNSSQGQGNANSKDKDKDKTNAKDEDKSSAKDNNNNNRNVVPGQSKR